MHHPVLPSHTVLPHPALLKPVLLELVPAKDTSEPLVSVLFFVPVTVALCQGEQSVSLPTSCQTSSLYCQSEDKPSHLASCMLAFSHCLINMAVTAALAPQLGSRPSRSSLLLAKAEPTWELQLSPLERPPFPQAQFPSARNFSDLLGSHLPQQQRPN